MEKKIRSISISENIDNQLIEDYQTIEFRDDFNFFKL